jgi:hypothetical protein
VRCPRAAFRACAELSVLRRGRRQVACLPRQPAVRSRVPEWRPSAYALQRISASMRCVWLCALSSSAVTFPLLSPRSWVDLQHIIATRATRPLSGRIADMRARRLPSNHRCDRITCCETPRITGSRLRRPRRAAAGLRLASVAISDQRACERRVEAVDYVLRFATPARKTRGQVRHST